MLLPLIHALANAGIASSPSALSPVVVLGAFGLNFATIILVAVWIGRRDEALKGAIAANASQSAMLDAYGQRIAAAEIGLALARKGLEQGEANTQRIERVVGEIRDELREDRKQQNAATQAMAAAVDRLSRLRAAPGA